VHDQAYTQELLVANRANGFRDILATIDLSTYRRLPWEKAIPFFLCSFVLPETGEALEADPRSVLEKVVSRATERGWKCMSGAEFEVGYFGFRNADR
jgi:glutamine synthetase